MHAASSLTNSRSCRIKETDRLIDTLGLESCRWIDGIIFLFLASRIRTLMKAVFFVALSVPFIRVR